MSNSFLIDTHCHLNMEQFSGEVDQIIENAFNNNVKYLHSICTNLEELDEIIAIAQKHENIYCSVGVHPCNVKTSNIPSHEILSKLSKHEKVISFGETGLDYYHPGFDKNAQKKSFENHIAASSIEKLPIIVHTRDAETDTIEILESEMKNQGYTGIIHCFTASYEFAKRAIDIGLYISVAGIVTFKNATELQNIISKLPLDRILVETDAPYLAPSPHRGKRNEPAYTKHTAEFLALLFGKNFDEIAEITTKNAREIFLKAKFV